MGAVQRAALTTSAGNQAVHHGHHRLKKPVKSASEDELPCPNVFEWTDSDGDKNKVEYSSKDETLLYQGYQNGEPGEVLNVTKLSVGDGHYGSETITLEGTTQLPGGWRIRGFVPTKTWVTNTGGDDSVYNVLKQLAAKAGTSYNDSRVP